MRIGRHVLSELGGGEAVASLVLVGVFVEVRHLRAGPAAGDHLDQLLAVETGLVQVRRLAGRARIATAVAVDAVAELAVRLLLKKALTEGHILRYDRIGTQQERGYEQTSTHARPRNAGVAVVPAKAGTHNHRLWNMGPYRMSTIVDMRT
jgi:hypothetical protein